MILDHLVYHRLGRSLVCQDVEPAYLVGFPSLDPLYSICDPVVVGATDQKYQAAQNLVDFDTFLRL